MGRVLNREDITDILYGAAFLSTGAGGALNTGLNMLRDLNMSSDIGLTMITAREMAPDEYAALAVGFGSPEAFIDANFGDEAVYAYEGFCEIMKQEGKKISYPYSLEYAGFNTFTPMYVAIKKGIPIIDADGNGKAVPDLATTLYNINGGVCDRVAMADQKGNITTYCQKDDNIHQLESVIGHMGSFYDMKMGISACPVKGSEVETMIIPGALSYAKEVGQVVRHCSNRGRDMASVLRDKFAIREICRGRVTQMIKASDGKFNTGTVVIRNSGDERLYFVEYKNENLILSNQEGVIATVPDNICTFSMDRLEPITNSELTEDMELAIYAAKAPAPWYKSGKCYDMYRQMLNEAGYSGEGVTLQAYKMV